MNNIKTDTIIKFLESLDHQSIKFYVEPEVETVAAYLDGLRTGFGLCLGAETIIHRARLYVIGDSEWSFSAESPVTYFKRKGISNERIIDELLRIEIDTWKRILSGNFESLDPIDPR